MPTRRHLAQGCRPSANAAPVTCVAPDPPHTPELMSTTRRDFLKSGAVAAAATLAVPRLLSASDRVAHLPFLAAPTADPFALVLAAEALGAARDAGASYADVRVGRYRRQSVATRERRITGV